VRDLPQRHAAVPTAIEHYLRPFLIGKDTDRIKDIWQTTYQNSYWRNGPVLNNALSGVDMALWDIKAKQAGMPLYQLLGGKCREGAAVYRHAVGNEPAEVEDSIRAFMAEGYQYIRAQMGFYGGSHWHTTYSRDMGGGHRLQGSPSTKPIRPAPEGAQPGEYYDPRSYVLSVECLFDHLRSELGFDIELLHDVHERLAPIDAVALAKVVEPHRLFFLEDPLAPEDLEWFSTIQAQTSTPIAMGELFNHPLEWTPLISCRLIDFMRMHISQMGGLTAARKAATLGEFFGIRAAWHGPSDVSPVGHAVNLHLDLACPNFGVQ
jgi:mannonate dehydratase